MEYVLFDTMRHEEVARVHFDHLPTPQELQLKTAELSERSNFRPGRCVLLPIQGPTPHADQ